MRELCFPWDDVQMDNDTEWRVWHQLWGVWKIDQLHTTPIVPARAQNSQIVQHATFEEAVDSCTGTRIFLDVDAADTLMDLPADLPNPSIIVGSSELSTKGMEMPGDLVCRVITPAPGDMYGFNAAAIVLAWLANRHLIGG